MNGDSIMLTATAGAGYTYLWSTGATTQMITVYNTATYTVTVTTTGVCTTSASASVYVLAPLPVELVNFNLREINDAIIITWTTAIEVNNDYFTVEHSANAIQWKEIKKVNGAGNSGSTNNYSVTDNFPVNGIN